jgi:hypothetical protein
MLANAIRLINLSLAFIFKFDKLSIFFIVAFMCRHNGLRKKRGRSIRMIWEESGRMAPELFYATGYQTVLQVQTPVCQPYAAFAGNLSRQ